MGAKDGKKSSGGSGSTSNKKAAKQSGGGEDDMKRETKLQAILLADSFTKTFRPLTHDMPKVMLPLVNVPMLEYTIEFLASNGVEELFVFCVWHAGMLQDYISNSKWNKRLTIKCITSNSCLSAGEALREIDSMGVVRSDPFILISGDVISNMDLKKAIQFHKNKRKDDFNAIMTVVLKKVHFQSKVKPILDDLVVAMDARTDQLLVFENALGDETVHIPQEVIHDHPALKFQTDLLDCHIDICSPELLLQFSDNFDYLDIRRHFIQNEVLNWELGMHIYGYILKNEYAARVHDPRTYHSISQDIIHRWAYPLVPDTHLIHNVTFSHSNRFLYKDSTSQVARSAVLTGGVVIGEGSVVEDGVQIMGSVIGRHCRILRGAVITESHIWEGAVIEQCASVTHAIIGEKVIIRQGAVINRGCVLSSGTVIGAGVVLAEFSRISAQQAIGDESKSCVSTSDVDVVGVDGVGHLWKYQEGDDYNMDEDYEEEDVNMDVLRASSLGCIEEQEQRATRWADIPEPVDDDSDADSFGVYNEEDIAVQNNVNFLEVVSEMVASGLKSNDMPENILMEIKGFKFAQNKDFSDCIQGTVPPLLDSILNIGATKGEFVKNCRASFVEGGKGYALLNGLCQDEEDELVAIEAIEDKCIATAALRPMFRFILQILHDSNVLKDESLLEWISKRSSESADSSKGVLFRQAEVQDFVNWLQEEEESGEDEEEDSEDD